MATLKELLKIERKYGGEVTRLAVVQLFATGYSAYRDAEDVEEILEDIRDNDRSEHANTNERLELNTHMAAWELAQTATISEIVCWCGRRKYFSIAEDPQESE